MGRKLRLEETLLFNNPLVGILTLLSLLTESFVIVLSAVPTIKGRHPVKAKPGCVDKMS
jgi:hypothetical protein